MAPSSEVFLVFRLNFRLYKHKKCNCTLVCVSVIDFFLSGKVSEPILLQHEQSYESSELVKLAQFPNLSLEDVETCQGLPYEKSMKSVP